MDVMLSERQIDPIGFAIRSAIAESAEPLHPALLAAVTKFTEMSLSISKIFAYARIITYVLDDTSTKKGPQPPTFFSGSNALYQAVQSLDSIVRHGDAEFLEYEGERTSAFIFAQATITLWSALEAGVRDMLIAVLGADSSLLEQDEVAKIQVSLSQFSAMDDTERIEHIVDKAEDKYKSKLSRGVGRFENMLRPFGFGGEVSTATSQELLEFSAVRNCLVHRQGIIDRRFLEACSIGQWKAGANLAVTLSKCNRFSQAALQYGATVASRVNDRYGAQLSIMKDIVARFTSELDNPRW